MSNSLFGRIIAVIDAAAEEDYPDGYIHIYDDVNKIGKVRQDRILGNKVKSGYEMILMPNYIVISDLDGLLDEIVDTSFSFKGKNLCVYLFNRETDSFEQFTETLACGDDCGDTIVCPVDAEDPKLFFDYVERFAISCENTRVEYNEWVDRLQKK